MVCALLNHFCVALQEWFALLFQGWLLLLTLKLVTIPPKYKNPYIYISRNYDPDNRNLIVSSFLEEKTFFYQRTSLCWRRVVTLANLVSKPHKDGQMHTFCCAAIQKENIKLEAVHHMFLSHCAVVMMVIDNNIENNGWQGISICLLVPVISPQRLWEALRFREHFVRGNLQLPSTSCDHYCSILLDMGSTLLLTGQTKILG